MIPVTHKFLLICMGLVDFTSEEDEVQLCIDMDSNVTCHNYTPEQLKCLNINNNFFSNTSKHKKPK